MYFRLCTKTLIYAKRYFLKTNSTLKIFFQTLQNCNFCTTEIKNDEAYKLDSVSKNFLISNWNFLEKSKHWFYFIIRNLTTTKNWGEKTQPWAFVTFSSFEETSTDAGCCSIIIFLKGPFLKHLHLELTTE